MPMWADVHYSTIHTVESKADIQPTIVQISGTAQGIQQCSQQVLQNSYFFVYFCTSAFADFFVCVLVLFLISDQSCSHSTSTVQAGYKLTLNYAKHRTSPAGALLGWGQRLPCWPPPWLTPGSEPRWIRRALAACRAALRRRVHAWAAPQVRGVQLMGLLPLMVGCREQGCWLAVRASRGASAGGCIADSCGQGGVPARSGSQPGRGAGRGRSPWSGLSRHHLRDRAGWPPCTTADDWQEMTKKNFPWRTCYKVARSKQGITASSSLTCSNTAIAELSKGSNTLPTDSTNLRLTM